MPEVQVRLRQQFIMDAFQNCSLYWHIDLLDVPLLNFGNTGYINTYWSGCLPGKKICVADCLVSLKRTEMSPPCPRRMSTLPKSASMDKSPLRFLISDTERHVNITGPDRGGNREPNPFLMVRESIWE